MLPRRSPDVARDADPFVENRPEQVERAELLDDTIADFLVFDFLGKGPEHPVPDDKYPA